MHSKRKRITRPCWQFFDTLFFTRNQKPRNSMPCCTKDLEILEKMKLHLPVCDALLSSFHLVIQFHLLRFDGISMSFSTIGGFHLHLLVFPFVYQFRRISTTFQHHFKTCLLWFLHEKNCSFYIHLFCCTEMISLFISSTAI